MRINHNIPALTALHQLDKSNSKLDKTLERLSSGLRINHAADDAAGLAITQKMDTQVRGLEQANRNAMDGISLIQTAEGALNEVHSMLQRIRELAVQVSNGTYDAADRQAVQDEVSQLQEEIQRISEDVEFNEMKLLNGDIDRRAFSTNSDIADIVSMSDTVEAGDYTFEVTQTASKTGDTGGLVTLFDENGEATVSGTININGEQVDIEAGETTEEVYSKLRDLASTVDVSMTILPSAPFGNDKQLSLELNSYGPDELEVTGDLELLTGLGLSATQFQPNSSDIYTATLPAATATTNAAATTVLINGTEVTIPATADVDDLYAAIEGANSGEGIEGIDMTFDASGNLLLLSDKEITIEADPNASSTSDSELVAGEIEDLATATTMVGNGTSDLTLSVPDEAIDTSVTTVSGDTLEITIGSTAYTIALGAAYDLSDTTDVGNMLAEINADLATATGDTDTTFTMQDGKLVAYNLNEEEVMITDSSNTGLVEALGYDSQNVTPIQSFGNLGRNVQVAPLTADQYDDLTTVNKIDGFPAGTTVTTDGQYIIFESNDNFELRLESGGETGEVTMNLLQTGPLDLQIGANEGQSMEIRIQNLSPSALGVTELNLSTSDGAQEAITTVDNAIETISSVRSKLGAYQNRLEYTITNLETAGENMTASLSRILDADMAYEMAQYTQQNIIQQAGTSMLAQANQRPQSLLQLLQS